MRVRCRAIADPRSNALGVLELESTADGLWLAYENVSSYREGYAPGPPALRSEHRVPWERVRASRMGAELLRLEVEEPLSPFSHFVLREFAHADPQPWSGRAGISSRLGSPQVVLTQLCHELSLRLGRPIVREVLPPGETAGGRYSGVRSLPRSGVALLILTCSAVLAGMMLSSTPAPGPAPSPAVFETSSPAMPGPPLPAQLPPTQLPPTQPSTTSAQRVLVPGAPNALELADLPSLPAPELGGGCECIRHESLLWQQPPPRLSAFITRQELRPHGSHQHVELELTVVNNGERELRGFSLAAQISTEHEDASNPEDDPVERTEYFPGPLEPGAQLTWHASARGDRFRVRTPALGRLDDDGIDAAPAAAFAKLAEGPPGLVRIHGATMLAFLGHPSARETLLQVREGLAGAELAHVQRALASTASLRICQLVVSSVGRATRTQSCLYNASEVPQSDFHFEVRAVRLARATELAPFAAAEVLAEETLDWSGTLPPRRGRRLDLTSDLSRAGSSAEHQVELLALSKARPE